LSGAVGWLESMVADKKRLVPFVPADADEQAQLEQAHIRRMRMKEIDEELAMVRQETSAT
jgi:hypothetical protein